MRRLRRVWVRDEIPDQVTFTNTSDVTVTMLGGLLLEPGAKLQMSLPQDGVDPDGPVPAGVVVKRGPGLELWPLRREWRWV